MKKVLALILVSVLSCIVLSGCGSNSEGDNDSSLSGNFYTAEVIPFPELPAGYDNIDNITLAGDIIYFTASLSDPSAEGAIESFKTGAIFAMAIDGTNLRKLPDYVAQAPSFEATGGGLFINAIHADKHGNIWVAETGRYYISEEPDITRDAGSTLTIRKLNNNGAELSSADISGLVTGFDGSYISMFIVDDEGYIYIGCNFILTDDTTIYVMDSAFNIIFSLDAPTWHNPFILMSDGSVAFVREQNNERFLQKIDITGRTWGENINLSNSAYNVFPGGNDYLIVFADSAGMYGISGESGEVILILNWIDTGVVPEGLGNISFLHDDRIFLTKSTPIHGSWDNKYEIIFLTKTESHNDEQHEGLAEKTELTLGTLYLNPPLQKAIREFNATSTTHYITVIDYSSNTTPGDTAGALLRFQTDITTGNIPDILFLSGMPFERLITLDLLVDLYPYLDADPYLSRDNLFESVLKANETDGKLYIINQTFTISTIVGNPSVLGEYPGWNMEEFRAVLDANPQADIPFGPRHTKHEFLWILLYMNLHEYIDMISGTADFNNEDFIDLLKFINTFPSEAGEFVYDPFFNRELKVEGRQIMDTMIPGLHNYKMLKESFGGEIVFKGWPSADRDGSRFISHDYIAITTHADDKEGAWGFIRTLFMEEQQREIWWNLPINRAVFEEQMKQNMEPQTVMHDGVMITTEPTQEDVDEIVSLIYSTTKRTGHGSEEALRNIIIESATDFFNGLISAEDAARIIQNRVSIFLAEQS